MKKFSSLIAILISLMLSIQTGAQTKSASDYFAGKWHIISKGTPNGDAKMMVSLIRKDGKLTGTILDADTHKTYELTKVEEKGGAVTLYFKRFLFTVHLMLERKDADHVTGSLMDKYNTKGERVIEKKS
jgi:hypothetical protein